MVVVQDENRDKQRQGITMMVISCLLIFLIGCGISAQFDNSAFEGSIWNELGISGGTAIIILIALYFVIKWAVKNGIKEAYSAITGKKTDEDIQNEKELKELGLDSEDQ